VKPRQTSYPMGIGVYFPRDKSAVAWHQHPPSSHKSMEHSFLTKLTLPHTTSKLSTSYYRFHNYPSLVLARWIKPTTSHLWLGLPNSLSLSLLKNCPPKLCMSLLPLSAACAVHAILLHILNRMIFGQEHKSLRSSSRNPPLSCYSLWSSNTFFSTPI
jgi:hypothetical protein